MVPFEFCDDVVPVEAWFGGGGWRGGSISLFEELLLLGWMGM